MDFIGVVGFMIVEGFFVENVLFMKMLEVVIVCVVEGLKVLIIGIGFGVVLLVFKILKNLVIL